MGKAALTRLTLMDKDAEASLKVLTWGQGIVSLLSRRFTFKELLSRLRLTPWVTRGATGNGADTRSEGNLGTSEHGRELHGSMHSVAVAALLADLTHKVRVVADGVLKVLSGPQEGDG